MAQQGNLHPLGRTQGPDYYSESAPLFRFEMAPTNSMTLALLLSCYEGTMHADGHGSMQKAPDGAIAMGNCSSSNSVLS